MKSPFGYFASNLGLKCLALLLAILVYYALRESVRSQHGRNVSPVFLKGPADVGIQTAK